jgi:hypothetical protein
MFIGIKMQQHKKRMVSIGLIIAVGLLNSTSASAVIATGQAEITLSPAAMATFQGPLAAPGQNVDGQRYMYIDTFYDQTVDSGTLNLDPMPPGSFTSQAQPFVLPVNDGSLPAGNILTTYDSVNNPSGVIGLGGTFRVRSDQTSPTGSVIWGELSLSQINGNWWLTDNLNNGTIFELKPDTLTAGSGNGALTLSADLIFGSTSGWGNFLQLQPAELSNTVVGHINLAPSAVPLPGAAWLFGSALLAVFGTKRQPKRSKV